MKLLPVAAVLAGAAALFAFSHQGTKPVTGTSSVGADPGHIRVGAPKPDAGHQLVMVSGGCFWGVENRFRHIPGVVATAVGYSGGHTTNPTYEQVCTHTTGHAESVLVEFDPSRVSYASLLDSFLGSIDPTAENRQGPDVGTNYRSAIWAFDEAQAKSASEALARAQKRYSSPLHVHVAPAGKFWLAEESHQQYDEKTGTDTCPTGG